MSLLSRSALITDITTYIYNNTSRDISGLDVGDRLVNIADSMVSKNGDSGILGLLLYSAEHVLSDRKELVYKGYADDLFGSIDLTPLWNKSGNTLSERAIFGSTSGAFGWDEKINNTVVGGWSNDGRRFIGTNASFTDTFFSVKSLGNASLTYAQQWHNSFDDTLAWLRDDGAFYSGGLTYGLGIGNTSTRRISWHSENFAFFDDSGLPATTMQGGLLVASSYTTTPIDLGKAKIENRLLVGSSGPFLDYAALEVNAPQATTNTQDIQSSYRGILLNNGVDLIGAIRTLPDAKFQISTDRAGGKISLATGEFLERLEIDEYGNFGFNGNSYGGGVRVLYLANAITASSVAPVGGVIIDPVDGALFLRLPTGEYICVAGRTVSQSGNYTQLKGDAILKYTGTGGHTFTLLSAASYKGTIITISNQGTGNLSANSSTFAPGSNTLLYSDGTNWI